MPAAEDAAAGKKRRRKKNLGKKMPGKKISKLKAAKQSKPIAFLVENLKRNGIGPALVSQTMRTLLALEFERFPDAPSFVDGLCEIQFPKVCGVPWESILASAHGFFLTEHLDECLEMFGTFWKLMFLKLGTVLDGFGSFGCFWNFLDVFGNCAILINPAGMRDSMAEGGAKRCLSA